MRLLAAWVLAMVAGNACLADHLTGTWQCLLSVKSLSDRSGTGYQFQATLYPNGRFQAQGVTNTVGETRMGSGSFGFSAGGQWSVQQDPNGELLIMRGQMTTPMGIPGDFTFGSIVRSDRLMTFEGQMSGHINRSSCQR